MTTHTQAGASKRLAAAALTVALLTAPLACGDEPDDPEPEPECSSYACDAWGGCQAVEDCFDLCVPRSSADCARSEICAVDSSCCMVVQMNGCGSCQPCS